MTPAILLDRLCQEVAAGALAQAERDNLRLAQQTSAVVAAQLRQHLDEQTEDGARLRGVISRLQAERDAAATHVGELIRRLRGWQDRCHAATPHDCDGDRFRRIGITQQVSDDLDAYLAQLDQAAQP